MSQLGIIPNCPETSPNLEQLVQSTIAAFEILSPWCRQGDGSKATTLIRIQAQSYAKAIDSSITAAQCGYNVTQEVLKLVQLGSSSDEAGRNQYWKNMTNYAIKGTENAVQVQNEFRNVRVILEELIKNAKKDRSSRENTDTADALDALQKNIEILEKFKDSVSKFVSWWIVLGLDHFSQQQRSSELQTRYVAYRDASVVDNWVKLKQKYVDYTCEIQEFKMSDLGPLSILRETPERRKWTFKRELMNKLLLPRRILA